MLIIHLTLAETHHIPLIGLGGDEDGVIGALAAVGLAASGDDDRLRAGGPYPRVERFTISFGGAGAGVAIAFCANTYLLFLRSFQFYG